MLRLAFCGLGAIGAPMARHLVTDAFDLRVWNRTAARAAEFTTTTGGQAARTPAEAAADRDVVVTCLPTSREVAALLDGPDGLLATLAPGATLLDCTSGDPGTSRVIAARLAARGVHFVDAPVSGGVSGAEAGTLTVMCGGAEADVARVRPVLEAFGRRIVHAGPVGTGHALKAVNNALLAVHLWSTAEGLAALAKSGVRPDLALEVINASSGRSNSSEHLFPDRVLSGAFPRTFRAALLDKDVGIAAGLAREARLPAPLLQLTAELWRMAHDELGEDADHVEVVRVVERLAGVTLRRGPLAGPEPGT
jgi:3-hydroxyisobutyrate dehydrogenase